MQYSFRIKMKEQHVTDISKNEETIGELKAIYLEVIEHGLM